MTVLEGLDPSNLVALHVLLEERHVTRAARRLGITQSSMSHRLSRLREALRDPLFVRSGLGLVPTARAEAIAGPLADALRALEAAVVAPNGFDPATSHYSVSILMPDILAPLAPRLVAGLTAVAPHLRVRLSHIGASLSDTLAHNEPRLALAPARHLAGAVITRTLGEVRFGVVGRRGHPALRGTVSTVAWLRYPHVLVRIGNDQSNLVQDEITRRGLQRQVALEVPSFLAGLFVVSTTDLLMNAPIPLVDEAAATLRLTIRDAPIRLPRERISLCWHERFQADPAHRWVRDRVYEVVRPAF
jgi:DNA-binding transcriptional LysR family regulator